MTAPTIDTTNTTSGTLTAPPVVTITTPPVAQVPVPTAPTAPVEAAAQTPADGGENAPQGKRRSLEDSLATLDETTRKYVLDTVRDARNEAKNLRERAKSADDVRNEITTAVAKAVGMEQAPADPATLAQQLSAQQDAATQAQRELAVFRAATTAGADPGILLNWHPFRESLKAIDPTDSNAITEAIKSAVADNPLLAGTPVRRAPGANPAAGSSANGVPDLDSQIADAQKRGDVMTVIRLQNQKLTAAPR